MIDSLSAGDTTTDARSSLTDRGTFDVPPGDPSFDIILCIRFQQFLRFRGALRAGAHNLIRFGAKKDGTTSTQILAGGTDTWKLSQADDDVRATSSGLIS